MLKFSSNKARTELTGYQKERKKQSILVLNLDHAIFYTTNIKCSGTETKHESIRRILGLNINFNVRRHDTKYI